MKPRSAFPIPRAFAVATQALALMFAAMSSLSAADMYLRIDGRYYPLDAIAEPFKYNPTTHILEVYSTPMHNCRRANGSAPAGGLVAMLTHPSYDVLYSSTADLTLIRSVPLVFVMQTPTGDVICDGSVPDPTPPPATGIFANGFD